MEQFVRFLFYLITLLAVIIFTAYLFAVGANGQTLDPSLQPDFNRVRRAQSQGFGPRERKGGYRPIQTERQRRPKTQATDVLNLTPANTTLIAPGTALSRILHTSQFSLNSSAGTNEQFVDRNDDLVADERTTFDLDGGSFDIAVGESGARYEVYSATRNQTLVGVLVVAFDTNGDYRIDSSATYDLQRDFSLPSAASVVTGTSRSGREFVVVCSSGYYNSSDPNDPNNEPSPGVISRVGARR